MQISEDFSRPRQRVRRSSGRRKSDRLRIEAVLGAAVLLAWAWGAYEVTLLFLK